MKKLEQEAKQWMKEKQMSGITASDYQHKACSTAIFPKGDVLWYCAMLAREVDMNLGSIMEGNLSKLADRKARNRLQGDGDNR